MVAIKEGGEETIHTDERNEFCAKIEEKKRVVVAATLKFKAST